ncbi:hypothetical protein [Pseudoalteromonas rhizosphaerae]|uniref:hypothetical protein n=1 Tax=Pseudoalteromonas rhizosphaerae TaxID=2518973 RepID=UPI00237F0093|nr:hypothetical protein [Pseudoalteromonas rhizosphaerae]
MASWELAKYLAAELVKEHNLKNAESWLTDEVLYLLNKYPELESYIDSKSGTLTISDIISAYLLSPRNNKKTKRLYLRGFKPETLYKLRLSHYLLAGFLFSTALRFCFNHRYNKQQLILWEIDYTESKKLILKKLAIQEIVVTIDKGKDTKGCKYKKQ